MQNYYFIVKMILVINLTIPKFPRRNKLKKFITLITSISFIILLSSCQALSSKTGLSESTVTFLGAVQQGTISTCKIIPTIKTISALVSVLYPAALPTTAALTTAEEICKGFAQSDTGEEALGSTVIFQSNNVTIEALVI